jgi:hypothetical protein
MTDHCPDCPALTVPGVDPRDTCCCESRPVDAVLAQQYGRISLWLPEQDRIRLAVYGKLQEELGELQSRLSRCLIHGLDERDPASGLTNREELEREVADVSACLTVAREHLLLSPLPARELRKRSGYRQWHQMIRDFVRSA